MSVTLEVSKLSGWLNAVAVCRESKGGHTVRDDVRWEAAGDRGARSVRERARLQIRAGHGEERTKNMEFMYVTLEVLRLSGWLNLFANCRESKGGHAVRGEVWPGR